MTSSRWEEQERAGSSQYMILVREDRCHPGEMYHTLMALTPADNPSNFLGRRWHDLRWSAWMPLMAAHPLALAQLPSIAGVYRVRRCDRPGELQWIGWAERSVRESVELLSRRVHLPVQPYDDPNHPAHDLWTLRRTEGASFEVSGSEVDLEIRSGPEWVTSLRDMYQSMTQNWHDK
jgi:hypothetical protein